MVNRRFAALPALALLVSSLSAVAAVTSAPYLVRNISTPTVAVSSSPHLFRHVGTRLFFVASDSTRGAEMWTSDGTQGGTQVVRDIREGPLGACTNTTEIVDFQGVAYFTAEGVEGAEPWRSTGGLFGTTLLKDIAPEGGSSPHDYTPASDQMFFIATDTATSVWVTDGTTAGTHLAVNGGWGKPFRISPAFGRKAFVFADNGTFLTTGAAQGTIKIADGTQNSDQQGLSINLSPTSALVAAGEEVYFVDQNGPTLLGSFPGVHAFTRAGSTTYFSTPDGIWTTDGTPGGTKHVSGAQAPELLVAVNNRLYFTALANNARRAWVSDGTSAGTFVLAPDEVMSFPAQASFAPVFLGAAIFTTSSGLWRTDGTPAGTTRLIAATDLAPDLASFGNVAMFAATDEKGTELWWTNGLPASTSRFSDLAGGNTSVAPKSPTAAFGQLFFLVPHADGYELWSSDGQEAATRRSELIPENLNVNELHGTCNGLLYMTACPVGSGVCSLWRSDGTPSGTFAVDDAAPARGAGCYSGALLYLDFNYDTHFIRLHKSLGTRATTSLVTSFSNGNRFALLSPIAAARGALFSNGLAYYVTDGTAAGTQQLYGLPGYASGATLLVSNSNIYVSGSSGNLGVLYRTDGSPEGTTAVVGQFTSGPGLLRAVGNIVYFNATRPPSKQGGLWLTDGTPEGTKFVATDPFPSSSIVAYHGLHYFLIGVKLNGEPRSGGMMVVNPKTGFMDIAPATDTIVQMSMPPSMLVAAGDFVFFPGLSSTPSATGIWKLDPATTKAQLVGTTSAALATPGGSSATIAGDKLYFIVPTQSGAELWALPYNGSRVRAVRH